MEFVNLKNGNYTDIVKWTGDNFKAVQCVLNRNYKYYYDKNKSKQVYNLDVNTNTNHSLYLQVFNDINVGSKNQEVNIPIGQYLGIRYGQAICINQADFENNYARPHIIYGELERGKHVYNYNQWQGSLNNLSKHSPITNAGGLLGAPYHYHVNTKSQLVLNSTYNKEQLIINKDDYIVTNYDTKYSLLENCDVETPKYVYNHYDSISRNIRTEGLRDHQVVKFYHIQTKSEHRINYLQHKMITHMQYRHNTVNQFMQLGQKVYYSRNNQQRKQIVKAGLKLVKDRVPSFKLRYYDEANKPNWWSKNKTNIYDNLKKSHVLKLCQTMALIINEHYNNNSKQDLKFRMNLINNTYNWHATKDGNVVAI